MREASPFASMCSGGDLRELLIDCSVVLRLAPFGERHAGMHLGISPPFPVQVP
jgi:hypothetical protein